jgi:hypothetical protein
LPENTASWQESFQCADGIQSHCAVRCKACRIANKSAGRTLRQAAIHRRDVRDFSAWAKSSLGLSPERLSACSPKRHEAKSIRCAMVFIGEDGVVWVMRTHGSALNGMAMWLTMLVPVLAWVTALVGSWFLN